MGGKRVNKDRTCTLDGCNRVYLAKGYCRLHYGRKTRTGDPNGVKVMKPVHFTAEERLLSHTNKSGGYPDFSDPRVLATRDDGECWVPDFTPAGKRKQYTQFSIGGNLRYTHRVAYELWVGKIPAGLYIDHRCRNTRCINPKHLEPVTASENRYRSIKKED